MNSLLGNSEVMINEAEYPIILYEWNSNLSLKGGKAVHVEKFSELQEIFNLAQSLGISLILIVNNDVSTLVSLLEGLDRGFYMRRKLMGFEEEVILKEILNETTEQFYKGEILVTREDLENEIFVGGKMDWDVKEAAKGFRERLIFCEREQRGWENTSEEFEGFDDFCEEEEDYVKCKEFCIKKLKELVSMKNQEKEKLVYYVNLGECYYKLKEYQKAFEYFIQSFDMIKFIYGETNCLTSYLSSRLDEVFGDLCEYQKENDDFVSLELQKPLENYLKREDYKKYLEIVDSYTDLAENYKQAGEHKNSLKYHLKALEMGKNLSGETHAEAVKLNYNVALAYDYLEEHEKAAEFLIKAIDIEKSISGETNRSSIAIGYENVAMAYEKIGKKEEAISFYSKALDMKLPVSEENHLDLSRLYQNLANLFYETGDNDMAIFCQKWILDIKKSMLGEIHQETALSFFHVGTLYFCIGDVNEALNYFLKALNIYGALNIENHEEAADSFYGAAAAFQSLKDYQKVVKYGRKARNVYNWILKTNSGDVDREYLKVKLVKVNQCLINCQQRLDYLEETQKIL